MASDAITESTNKNIASTTRDLWKRSVVSQVFLQMPLYTKLLLRHRVTWKGGVNITCPVQTSEQDGYGQWYSTGTGMTAGHASTLTKPWFGWKKFQQPVTFDIDEELQNSGGSETEVVDLAALMVQQAHRATRINLYKAMYRAATVDTDRQFSSVVQALTHDQAYAHTTRTVGSSINTWWQGASIDESYTDQATQRTWSIGTFRDAHDAADRFVENDADYLCVVGSAGYLKLKAQVDASTYVTNPGELVKYGFESFTLDGVEVVKDKFLRANGLPDETNPQYWFFLLNVNDWELRLHPKRAMTFKPFKWQGDVKDGPDEWLARVMMAGNLCCWRPNGSIFLSNVQ